jgi:tRNA_anti-like
LSSVALLAAIVAAAGAFSFQYWESHLQEPTRKVIRELVSNKALVAASVLIFSAYVGVVVPDLIGRLGKLNLGTTSAPTKVITTSPEPPPTPTPAPTQERVFTDRTPGELMALFEGRTMFQANQLIEPQKGKWIKVRGTISQIIPNGPPGASTIELRVANRIINCNIGAEWSARVIKLNNGDVIQAIGKIQPFQNGQQLYLLDCDLVD